MAVAYWDYRHDIAIIDGIIVKSRRIVVPQKMRECLLQKLHRVHQGIDKSIQRARDKWFWPGMTEQIRRLILTCPSCLEHQPRPKQAEVIPVIQPMPCRYWVVIFSSMLVDGTVALLTTTQDTHG